MTQYIKAPFNFVPLNEKVFFPQWADKVSHDIPFSDGESGEIELELEAMTPIFVRNGHTHTDAETKNNEEYVSFSKDAGGNYFIPGTSVKGMIRNVLEIMSFGKMKVDKAMKFAQREWNNKYINNKDIYPIKKPEIQNSILCGWLEIKENEDSLIYSCGLPLRINHLRIDEYFRSKNLNVSFKKQFSKYSENDLGKEREINQKRYDPKEASFKYALINNNFKVLENISFMTDEKYSKELNRGQQKAFCERRVKVAEGDGEFKGTIVFTGQPDTWVNPEQQERKLKSGKFYEFVFPEHDGTEFKVPGKTIQEFKFIYKDSPSWIIFKNRNRIPVFFRVNGDTVIDFGLALLYRLPYKNSVSDLMLKNQMIPIERQGAFDLVECILGTTEGKHSLKSRVQFSPFKASGVVTPNRLEYTTLGLPKASYYPIYLEQNGVNGIASNFVTYQSDKAILSGRKRYPVKRKGIPRPTGNNNLDTPFVPLPEKTLFKGKIRFHNLKPVEIGALLSSVTFHGNQDKLFHNIGMGKPLGYGKIKVDVKGKIHGVEIDIFKYLSEFEKEMNKFCQHELNYKWHSSEIITELLSMADDVEEKQEGLFSEYMKLDIENKTNDFISAKEHNEYLSRFTELTKKRFLCKSISAIEEQKEIEAENRRKEAEEKRLKEEREEAERLRKKEEECARLEKRQKEIEEGPLFLKDVKDFNGAKSRMDQWLKKANVELLPIEYHELLFDTLLRFYNDSKPRDRQKWELSFENNPIWKKITSWVGMDISSEWYGRIVKK